MRIYKIKNSEKFEKAKAFLKEIKTQGEQNLKTIKEEITPFKWETYLGYDGVFYLLTNYLGFKPSEKIKETPSGWRYDKDNPTCLVPNKRTKIGKELAKKLNDLPNYSYQKLPQLLEFKINENGRFTIPHLRITKNKKIIFLIVDDKVKLKKKDFKEVTITYTHKKLGIKE